jgi:CBS domain-containing protein
MILGGQSTIHKTGGTMTTVQNILRRKGHAVFSILPDTTVSVALELMLEKDVGALLVIQNGDLAGIFSERDFARKVILKGRAAIDLPVKDLMTTDVITVTPDQSIDECMALMTNHRIRHLPVVEHRRVTGIVSIGDAVAALNSEKEQLIVQLENYITGAR